MMVYLNFENPLPHFNTQTFPVAVTGIDEVWAGSCNPPVASGWLRGSYFNGWDNFIQINGLNVKQTFETTMWFSAYNTDATLL
jgi:hypothetical protein